MIDVQHTLSLERVNETGDTYTANVVVRIVSAPEFRYDLSGSVDGNVQSTARVLGKDLDATIRDICGQLSVPADQVQGVVDGLLSQFTVEHPPVPKEIDFTLTDDDNVLLGRLVIQEVLGNPSVVDISGYQADGAGLITNPMRVYADTIERQVPPTLNILGIEDQSQQDAITAKAVAWVVALTGGSARDYTLSAEENEAVHVIAYSDGLETLFPICIMDGSPQYDPREVVKPSNASYAVTRADEPDDEGFRRATIARAGYPTHVVRWKQA